MGDAFALTAIIVVVLFFRRCGTIFWDHTKLVLTTASKTLKYKLVLQNEGIWAPKSIKDENNETVACVISRLDYNAV